MPGSTRALGSGPDGEARARLEWVGWLVAGCLVLFAGIYAIEASGYHRHYIHDDAYITLRYARNLAEGNGLVWNPGEAVEGYTSLAAVLLCGFGGAVGIDLVTAALIANLLGIGLLVASCALVMWPRRPARWAPLVVALPLVMLIGNRDLLVWMHGRLEAPLFAGAIAVAMLGMVRFLDRPRDRRRFVWAALAVGALPLFRPDGGLLTVIGIGFAVLAHRRESGIDWRGAAWFAALALAPAFAHMVFRIFYYGDVLPNTVWAKVMFVPTDGKLGNGVDYVAGFFAKPPYTGLAALASIPLALRSREQRWVAAFLTCCLLGYLAMIALAGGDHMPSHRLLVPLLPVEALLVFLGLRAVGASRPARRVPLAAGGIAVGLAVVVVVAMGAQRAKRALIPDPAALVGEVVGRYLAEQYEPGTLVAINAAGAPPYFAPQLRFIDTLGLNDRHIAHRRIDRARLHWQTIPGHAKGDGAYVLERNPDIIVLGPVQGTELDDPWFLGDLELIENPLFHERYRQRTLYIPARNPQFWAIYETDELRLILFERVAQR